LIKTFYPIRIAKGRRKQRRDLRGDILKGRKEPRPQGGALKPKF
jgi:hypothetical protein